MSRTKSGVVSDYGFDRSVVGDSGAEFVVGVNPPITYRFANDGLEDVMSASTALSFEGQESLTVQSLAEETNINVIVKRFGVGANLPAARALPEYGDFTGVADFQEALNRMDAAQAAFDSLPAETRRRFGDNPALLLEFLHDPSKKDEARKLGLLKPEEPVPAPMKVQVVPDPAAPLEGAKPAS